MDSARININQAFCDLRSTVVTVIDSYRNCRPSGVPAADESSVSQVRARAQFGKYWMIVIDKDYGKSFRSWWDSVGTVEWSI